MISNSKLIESAKIVNAFPPGIPSSAAPVYVSMKDYKRCSIIIVASKDSTGSTCAIGVNQATAVAGTNAKALNTFTADGIADSASGTLGGAITAVSDTYAATTVTTGSFTIPTTASKNAIYVVEVNSSDLDVANGFDCIQLTVGNSAHQTISVVYILRDPRYADAATPTSITD